MNCSRVLISLLVRSANGLICLALLTTVAVGPVYAVTLGVQAHSPSANPIVTEAGIKIRPRIRSSSQSKPNEETTAAATAQDPSSQIAPSPADPANQAASADQAHDEQNQALLEAERKQGTQLHPLQKADPDHSLVICEAGCGDSRTHILTRKPNTMVRSVASDMAAIANAPITSLDAECQGGCPYTSGSRQALATPSPAPVMNDKVGDWMTSVKPEANAAPTQAKPQAKLEAKPEAKTGAREDWMGRINRERAQAKSQTNTSAMQGANVAPSAPAAPATTENAASPNAAAPTAPAFTAPAPSAAAVMTPPVINAPAMLSPDAAATPATKPEAGDQPASPSKS